MDNRIAEDRALIKACTCPVCGLHFGDNVRDPYRSLKQHMRRRPTEHAVWRARFWKIHFVVGGYRYVPKTPTIEDVIDLTDKYLSKALAVELRERINGCET